MQRAKDYVEHLKRKPLHERERIAAFSAGAVTFVIALGYLVAITTSDRLTLDSAPRPTTVASEQRFSDLLGAAAAFNGSFAQDGEITVVESKRSSTLESSETGSATVIPF